MKYKNRSKPRRADRQELQALANYLLDNFPKSKHYNDREIIVDEAVEYASIAVFDDYPLLGSDAYPDGLGKVMSVGGSDNAFHYTVYYWKNDQLERLNHDSEYAEEHYYQSAQSQRRWAKWTSKLISTKL